VTAEILLINPKYGHNLGAAVRAAATLGAEAVHWTGDRVDLTGPRGKDRLPREERLRGYDQVRWGVTDGRTIFDRVGRRGLVPVAVEIVEGAERLTDFEHPEDAVYVFGPEDGGLGGVHLRHCHRFAVIPTRGCVNLAAAVYIVLYDRLLKTGCREDALTRVGRSEDVP
jgi:tRNA(Leu) C34 or U34 (ribose-2'-O)-methylase TrmL